MFVLQGPAQAQNLRDSLAEAKSDIVVKVSLVLHLRSISHYLSPGTWGHGVSFDTEITLTELSLHFGFTKHNTLLTWSGASLKYPVSNFIFL